MTPSDKELALKLYEQILRNANRYLMFAKRYELGVLRGFNPSFKELAEIMQELATTVGHLIDELDPMMAHQANEYVFYVREMAIAITQGDSIQLDKVVNEFDKKPFILPE